MPPWYEPEFYQICSVFGWDETLQVQDSSLGNQWFMVNDLQALAVINMVITTPSKMAFQKDYASLLTRTMPPLIAGVAPPLGWLSMDPPEATGRDELAAVACGGCIYAMGGSHLVWPVTIRRRRGSVWCTRAWYPRTPTTFFNGWIDVRWKTTFLWLHVDFRTQRFW